MAHAKYYYDTGSNNNMGTEVDWRDMKGECLPSSTLSTLTGTVFGFIGQIGAEHRLLLSNHEPDLFQSRQYMTKRVCDELQSTHYCSPLCLLLFKARSNWDAVAERIHMAGELGAPLSDLSISRSKCTM